MAFVVLAACSTTKPSKKIDKVFLEPLLVFPLNDVRSDKRIKVDPNAPVNEQWMAENLLLEIRNACDNGLEQNVSFEDLQQVRREKLKLLPRKSERYALILYLNSLSIVTEGSIASCKITGFLVDTATGDVLWKNTVYYTKSLLETALGLATSSPFEIAELSTLSGSRLYQESMIALFVSFPMLEKSEECGTPNLNLEHKVSSSESIGKDSR
jgi:hypothetical protein